MWCIIPGVWPLKILGPNSLQHKIYILFNFAADLLWTSHGVYVYQEREEKSKPCKELRSEAQARIYLWERGNHLVITLKRKEHGAQSGNCVNKEAHLFIFLTWPALICGARKTTSKRDWGGTALGNIFKYCGLWYNQQNNTCTMVVHVWFKNTRDFKMKIMKYLRDKINIFEIVHI